jgi:hypothetical protein
MSAAAAAPAAAAAAPAAAAPALAPNHTLLYVANLSFALTAEQLTDFVQKETGAQIQGVTIVTRKGKDGPRSRGIGFAQVPTPKVRWPTQPLQHTPHPPAEHARARCARRSNTSRSGLCIVSDIICASAFCLSVFCCVSSLFFRSSRRAQVDAVLALNGKELDGRPFEVQIAKVQVRLQQQHLLNHFLRFRAFGLFWCAVFFCLPPSVHSLSFLLVLFFVFFLLSPRFPAVASASPA